MMPVTSKNKKVKRKNAMMIHRSVSEIAQMVAQGNLDVLKVDVNQKFRKVCRTLTNHTCWVNSVSVTDRYVPILQRSLMNDDLRMRCAGVSASSGPSIAVFDIETGQTLFSIDGHETVVYSVAISHPSVDSALNPVIVTGSHDGLMKIWELKTGEHLLTIGEKHHRGPVRAVCVIEGRLPMVFSASENDIWVWLLENGDKISCMTGHHTKSITRLCAFRSHYSFVDYFNPAVIASGSLDGLINVYDIQTFELRNQLISHTGPVYDIVIMRHKKTNPLLLSCSFDQTIKIWDIVTGQLESTLTGHTCAVHAIAVINSKSPGIVSGSADGKILIWNMFMRSIIGELKGHTGPIRSLCVSMEPRVMILSGSYDSNVKVWDITIPGNDESLLYSVGESLRLDEALDSSDDDNDDDNEGNMTKDSV